TGSLVEHCEPESRPASPVRSVSRARHPRPPPVPGTHIMALRPSSVPQRVALPSPPGFSFPGVPELESDLARAASLTITRFFATVVTDPSFESTTSSALVTELVDFAATPRLDYVASSLIFECLAAVLSRLASMLLCLEGDPDALDIPTPRSYEEAIRGEYSSQWQTSMYAEMASWKSTGTYVDEVSPPRANIVDGMWIFRVKQPPGSPPAFKARYVARGFSQRQGVDFFQTFSPTPKMTTLRVLLHVAAQRDYELPFLDFYTTFLQGSLHEEIWLRRPLDFTGLFPEGTQWSLRRPVYGLRQAPRDLQDTLRTTLTALGFAPSTVNPSLFLRTNPTLTPFYILVYVDDLVFATPDTEALTLVKAELKKRYTCTDLGEVLQRFGFQFSSPQCTPLPTGHSLSAPPSDESVEPSGPYPELVGCPMYLMTCTRPDLAYPLSILARFVAPGTSGMGLVLGQQGPVVLTGHSDASWADDQATQRSSQGYYFSLGSGSILWRSTRSSSVLGSSFEAEIWGYGCTEVTLADLPADRPGNMVSYTLLTWPLGPTLLMSSPRPLRLAPARPVDPAAQGASESALPGIAPTEALHTFTLDSGASRCFFRDSTTLTPLSAPVPVRLADPSGGPVVARSSTVLPCLVVPSGSLSCLHLPSFSTNLVSTAALQDVMVTTTTPVGQHVSKCTCTRTGRHLARFTRRPGSSLYTLATEPPQVAASAQVSASGTVAPPCSCRLLSHQTLLWHHRLGHPSLPRLRGMHSRLLVSGLPRSLPPLPPSPAPPCLPCFEGRQRAAPHSSSFPTTSAPLQTLHMDVWGPARVSEQGRERYFLLVVDDYTRYTTVFPLRSKGEVPDVLIPWIRAVRLQLRERFHQDLPVLHLHSDRGGEFSTDLLQEFFMEVAHTSMIHAAAPHFLWPFATSPTLRWTGEVGDASVFRGSRAFVRDTSADKISARAIPCVFLGFPPDAPGWQFYHPTSRRVFPSQDVTFDESVYFLFPYRSAPPPPPPLFLAPGPPPVTVGASAARGAASRGAEPGGAESEGVGYGGAEPGGAEPVGVELGGAESEGTESGGAEPQGTTSSGGPAGASPRLSPRSEPLSPQQLCEWFALRTRLRSGAARAGDPAAGDTGAGAVGVTGGARGTGGAAAGDHADPGGAGARDTGAGGAGAGGAGAGDPRAVGAGAGGGGAGDAVSGGTGAGGTVRPRSYFVPLLHQVLGLPSSADLTPPLLCPPPDQSQPPVPRPRPPPVPGTHAIALRPSSIPLRVPLPPPPESSLPAFPDPESDLARAASPTVSHLLATVVTDPSFESTVASALVAELVDFAAACRLDYVTALVAESASASPPSIGGECALGTDVLEDRHDDFECLAADVPRFASMLLAPEGDPDAPEIPTPRSYEEAITVAALGFAPSTVDPSLFLCTDTSLPPFYVLVYVDDLVFATGDTEALTLMKSELQKRHNCTDLGELRNYLGLQITRDRAWRTIILTQSHMVHQVLQCFGFQFSSPQPTPLSIGHSLSAPPSDKSVEPSGPYPELVGCLMYLMTCTRPDPAYPLSLLARYVAPGRHRKVHWDAAKRVLHYLCSTLGIGLVLGGRGPVVLTGHADAS
ncbi:unnamed protein product, partial [Closterium sp. NIES-54]